MTDTHTRTQHTPGPWYTMERGENALSIEAELYDGSAHPVTLATATNCIMEGEANARLIAAAPLMAATLVAIIDALKLAQGYGFEEELSIAQGALEAAGVNPEGYEAMELRHQ